MNATGTRTISFKLNGAARQFEIAPDEKLLDLLRRSGCLSVKFGCGEGTCGSCTVILDGKAVYACILFAFQADGREVWTLEGLGDYDRPHPIQQALVDAGAVQCGYCIPGMILAAKAMIDQYPHPTDEQIRQQMDGNICRCTGYEKIWQALQQVCAANP